jgi:putative exporter of polyketide antibiotics
VQLVENAGAANSIAVAALAYLARAAGDAGQGDLWWLSWASPIGWAQQIRPFAGERWWISSTCAYSPRPRATSIAHFIRVHDCHDVSM